MRCPGCPAAPNAVTCRSQGPQPAPLMIVGMAPGSAELLEGVPFVGPSGRVLKATFAFAGLRRADVRLANVCNCSPMGPNDTLSPEQTEACRERLAADIAATNPRVILCLGGEALHAVTGHEKISEWQGYVQHLDGRIVIGAYHPSFVMRSGMKPYPWLRQAVSRAARASREGLVVVAPPRTPAALPGSPPSRLSFDIETVGFTSQIERIGLAWPSGATSLLWTYGIFDAIRRLLGGPGLKIAHNMNFDIPRLRKAGIEVRGEWHDTLWGAQLIDPDAPGYSLNEVAPFYLDLERWKHEGNPGSRRVDEMHGVPPAVRREKEREYNLKDAFYLLPIQAIQAREIERTGQGDLWRRVMGTLPTLIDLQLRGLRVDMDAQASLRTHYEARARWAEERWAREVGPVTWRTMSKRGVPLRKPIQEGGVNPKSQPQLAKLLYTDWGLPAQYRKEKGRRTSKLTTDAEAIENLYALGGERTKALRALLRCRHYPKFIETYLSCDERIYPAYAPSTKDDNPGGRFKVSAATGRITARGGQGTPPIQQLPKPLRRIILPSRPGYVFVKADYDSQELRILAAISGDGRLLGQLARGENIHSANAALLRCDRTRAKNAFYGWCFGASPLALVRAFKQYGYAITKAEAGEFLDAYNRLYPGVRLYHREVFREACEHNYVRAGSGRRRYFYDPEGAFNEIVNFKIQEGGSHMAWENVGPVDELASEYDGNLSILVHDEFVCEVPPSAVAEFTPRFKALLEREFPAVAPGFTCPVTTGTGPSWGEA